jgi:hypothetical protein
MNATIYFLNDYDWEKGEIIGVGPKRYKIKTPATGMHRESTRYVSKEKCAMPDEKVCVVWETWRGTNGRGGYRVEREWYAEHRVPAKLVAYQSHGKGRVTEAKLGEIQ